MKNKFIKVRLSKYGGDLPKAQTGIDDWVQRAANANLNFWEKCRLATSANNGSGSFVQPGDAPKQKMYASPYEELADLKGGFFDKEQMKNIKRTLPQGVSMDDWVGFNREAGRLNVKFSNPDYSKYTDSTGMLKPEWQSVATNFDPYYLYYRPAFANKNSVSAEDIMKFYQSQPGGISNFKLLVNNGYRMPQRKHGGPIVDSRGQWAHPGKVTRIPSSNITMKGVPYPVLGVGNNGQSQMMYPGMNYDFGGASYVDEYPMMENGGGIPERYKNMGFTHVGQKKEGDGQHKWKVLAKKGNKYKIVQGGYRGMEDFSQHHSKQRQENFWNRMGGRDSAKAKDPFSPLYWHKRLGKWEEGGQTNDDREMLEGVADILRRVKDTNNRKDIANYMMNNFRDEDVSFVPQDFLKSANVFKQGGEMIRRADGHYSRRGLWDNIRANRGSGKEPTKQMLEQERKIKASMQYGGGWFDEEYSRYLDPVKGGFLQPNSPKLPFGYYAPPNKDSSSELASSIGGENGEPAYLIPTFKYGKRLNNPLAEYRRTGEHLGGPFKTWQEADEWDQNVRHPYVEKGLPIPSPLRTWGSDFPIKRQMGGSLPSYQTRGQVNFSPNDTRLVPQFVAPAPGTFKIPTTDVERYAAQKSREIPVTIRPAQKPRSALAQAWVENAYPMTALKYKMHGQDVPQYFERGDINPFDHALAVVNPFRWLHDFSNTGNDLAQGNYTQAAFDMASVLPFLSEFKSVSPGLKSIAQDVNQAGKYLTTQTPLKNAYRFNPRRFNPNPEAYYHRSPNLENIINQETGTLQGFGQSEEGRIYNETVAKPGAGNTLLPSGRVSRLNLKKPAKSELYFSRGTPLDWGRTNMILDKKTGKLVPGQGYEGPYIAEVTDVPFISKANGKLGKVFDKETGEFVRGKLPPPNKGGYAVAKNPVPLNNTKFYVEDWWKGYKPVEVQVPKSQSSMNSYDPVTNTFSTKPYVIRPNRNVNAKDIDVSFTNEFIDALNTSDETIRNQGVLFLDELRSAEGVKRLKNLFKLAEPNLNEEQLNHLVGNRLFEIQTATNYNKPNQVLGAIHRSKNHFSFPDEKSIIEYLNRNFPRENAHWASQNFHPSVPVAYNKPVPDFSNLSYNPDYNRFISPDYELGAITLGPRFMKNVKTLDHEMTHALQQGNMTPIDKMLKELLPVERSSLEKKFNPLSPYMEEQKNYFDFSGFRGQDTEPYAFLSELRRSMIENNILKHRYDEVTPWKLLKSKVKSHYSLQNPVDAGTRLIQMTPFWKLSGLSKIMNIAPMGVPAAIGLKMLDNNNPDIKRMGGSRLTKAQSGLEVNPNTIVKKKTIGSYITPIKDLNLQKINFNYRPTQGSVYKPNCPQGVQCAEQAVDYAAEKLGIPRINLIPGNAAYRTAMMRNEGMIPIWDPYNGKSVDVNYVPFPVEKYKDLKIGDQVGLTTGGTDVFKYDAPPFLTRKNNNHVEHWGTVSGFDQNGTPTIRHGYGKGANRGRWFDEPLDEKGTVRDLGHGRYRIGVVYRSQLVGDEGVQSVNKIVEKPEDIAQRKANTTSSAKFYLKTTPEDDLINSDYPVAANFAGAKVRLQTKKDLLGLFQDKELDYDLKYKLGLTQQELDRIKPVVYGMAGQESNFDDPKSFYNNIKEQMAFLKPNGSLGMFQIKLNSLTDEEKQVLGINKKSDLKDTRKAYMAAVAILKNSKRIMDQKVAKGVHPELNDPNIDPYFRALYYYNTPQRAINSTEEMRKKEARTSLNPVTWLNWLPGKQVTNGDLFYNTKKNELRMDPGSYPYKVLQKAKRDLGVEYDNSGFETAPELEAAVVYGSKNPKTRVLITENRKYGGQTFNYKKLKK